MITVPEQFATDTITREGQAGCQWIASLPERIEALCRQWELRVDGLVMHGYLGIVIPVLRGSEPCVLKVSWIDEATADAIAALRAWNGGGAVRLLAEEPAFAAILLERLDYRRSLSSLPISAAMTVAGTLLRRLAIPASRPLRTQQSITEEICRILPERWELYGRPIPRRRLDYICELAAQLAVPDKHLLVNYDLHYENVLAGTRELWLAVDPKIIVGTPEFGVAQLIWCRLEDIQANGGLDRLIHIVTEAGELDLELTRSWTLVRCVDYWLWGLRVGLTEDPARCAVITDWLLGS